MLRMTACRRRWARAPLLGHADAPDLRAAALSTMAATEAATARRRRDTIDAPQRGRPYCDYSTSDLGTMGRRCADAGDGQGLVMVLEELAQRDSVGARRLRERLVERRVPPV